MSASNSHLKNMKFKTFLFALTICFHSTVHAGQNQIPLEHFIEDAHIEWGTVSLSPDGKHYSVVVPYEKHSALVIFDAATRKPKARIDAPKDEYISDYWWVTDSRIVGTSSVKDGYDETPSSTGELWGIDVDGTRSRSLFSRIKDNGTMAETIGAPSSLQFATVLEPKADAENQITIGINRWEGGSETERMRIAKMNIYNGAIKAQSGLLPIRYLSSSMTDSSGRLAFVDGVDTDGLRKLYYRPNASAEWVLLNDQAKSRFIIEPLAYMRSGHSIFVRVYEEQGLAYLASLNPDSNSLKKLFSGQHADIGGAFLAADDSTAYAVENQDDLGGYVFLDQKSSETILVKELMNNFPGQKVIATSFSRDGFLAIILVYSDINPGSYYLYDQRKKTLTELLKARPKLSGATLQPMEQFRFKAQDGTEIFGWLTLPAVNVGEKAPLVIIPHGGPYGVYDRWGYDSDTQLLVNRGYAVAQINFRGSGGRGLSFELAGHREWGGKMQTDITDGVNWLIAQDKVDSKRICIFGYSYGAYASLMAVAKEPGLFKCAVGFSGVYDLSLMSKKGDINDTAYGRNYLREVLIDDPEWLRQRSPVYLAAQIKAPVLLIHGGADERTPSKHATAMRSALEKNNNPPQWLFKQNEGHGFYNQANRKEAYELILRFLDQNLTQ
jgi:dipeptidyl aminopeptidase/acylaminoacyl peptidase